MFRLYDWQCDNCAMVHESVICIDSGSDAPRTKMLVCPDCGEEHLHIRLIPLPAQYMGEKPLNPMVKGGTFDTEGYKRETALPEFKGNRLSELKDHVNTKEYKEIKKLRAFERSCNLAKRKRAAAIRRGENVSMRHNKLPGDPSFSS